MTATDTIKVDLPTTRSDTPPTPLALNEMASLKVYQQLSAGPSLINTISLSGNTASSIEVPIPNLAAGSYGYCFSVVDTLGDEGVLSAVYPVVIKAPLAPPAAPTVESDVQA